MAMNADILGALIGSKMDTAIAGISDPVARRAASLKALAEAVIEHIQAAATIPNLAVIGTSPSGAVTGTASGGAGSIL